MPNLEAERSSALYGSRVLLWLMIQLAVVTILAAYTLAGIILFQLQIEQARTTRFPEMYWSPILAIFSVLRSPKDSIFAWVVGAAPFGIATAHCLFRSH